MIDTIPVSTTLIHAPEPVSAKRREFLTPIPELPGEFLLVMDNTAMEKVQRCPTAGRYYLVVGREGHAKNAALAFGGAIHEGLESFYKHETTDEQNQAILRYFTENPAPPDEYRTPQTALDVMGFYRQECAVREDYKWLVLSDGNGDIIERPFEIPLGVLEIEQEVAPYGYIKKIHVAWSGRIDIVASCFNYNRVVDHKTTSIEGDQFIQSFQLSHQTIGYVWAAQQMFPNLHPLNGFCLNAIRLKKPTGKVGLTDKGPRGGEPALKFFRAYFEYSQERIDQWAANALAIIEDFVHCLMRDFFPLYTNHCFNKFGRCPYFDIDTIDDQALRLRMLNSDAYKDVTWDPTVGR